MLFLPILDRVDDFPDRSAIIDSKGRRISYAELELQSSQLAAAWKAEGLHFGMRVLVAEQPSISFYVAILALWRIGAAAIFAEPFTGLEGIRHAARKLSPDGIIASGKADLLLRFIPETRRISLRLNPRMRSDYRHGLTVESPDEIASYSFGRDNAGASVCVARSHRFMLAQNKAMQELLHSDDDIDLVWCPEFVFFCLATGSTAVLPRVKPQKPGVANISALTQQVEDLGISRLIAPPPIVIALGRADVGFNTIFTHGTPVSPHDMPQIAAMSSKAYVMYGCMEAEPVAVLDLDDVGPEEFQHMCDGKGVLAGYPVHHVDVRIRDDEILVAGQHIVEGYVGVTDHETKVRIDDRIWHRTGDGGHIDMRGRLWLQEPTRARSANL